MKWKYFSKVLKVHVLNHILPLTISYILSLVVFEVNLSKCTKGEQVIPQHKNTKKVTVSLVSVPQTQTTRRLSTYFTMLH